MPLQTPKIKPKPYEKHNPTKTITKTPNTKIQNKPNTQIPMPTFDNEELKMEYQTLTGKRHRTSSNEDSDNELSNNLPASKSAKATTPTKSTGQEEEDAAATLSCLSGENLTGPQRKDNNDEDKDKDDENKDDEVYNSKANNNDDNEVPEEENTETDPTKTTEQNNEQSENPNTTKKAGKARKINLYDENSTDLQYHVHLQVTKNKQTQTEENQNNSREHPAKIGKILIALFPDAEQKIRKIGRNKFEVTLPQNYNKRSKRHYQ